MSQTFLRITATIAALFLAACSSYETRWKAAQSSGDAYAGAYEGRWQSSKGGMGGSLRCILAQQDARHYEAWFHATWHGVFQSKHHVLLATTPERGGLAFGGTAKIDTAIGSGSYTCNGHLTPGSAGKLNAAYDAKYDTGTFRLQRVKSP